ncbi:MULTISPECIES: hypothetical protein [unclassified Streptomyces]|uniref:hypothetical protein n=1 Tax=unclassified Streptomyces TaxID=2593676 RepID=UPI0013C92135|nr:MULTISPECIES: hypothetical protein [unclassified Streptomyces]NDZ75135.1 hypothetical protein [Streptomyces sp. SID10362]QUW95413.1 hypothetical protein KE639_06682 [Streptomyces sp. V17-9]
MDATERQPLEDLVHWNGELSELIEAARHGDPTATVTLRRDHTAAALEKVATGLASPSELIDWAQVVHLEERVDVDEGHQDLLTQSLVEVSTPELFEPVTLAVCQRWLHTLRAVPEPCAKADGR